LGGEIAMSFSKTQFKRMERAFGKKRAREIRAEVRSELIKERIIRQFEANKTVPTDKMSYH